MNEGLHRKVTLITAPAGYGKTTMLSEWIPQSERCVTWVSLDEGDNDPVRFLAYFIAALQMLDAEIGRNALALMRTPLPSPIESILTTLLNEIAAFPDFFALVLDDYHVIDARPVDEALTYLLEHLPPQMHLVITSREEPNLPLARLRARDQLTEIRAADLRFSYGEVGTFLNQVMDLELSDEKVAALEARTEGWIAGLQLAALSMRGREDVHEFIEGFAGDNRYIVDYLVEEVLQRQSLRVRSFLLQTSILNWLSGPLCDAVTGQEESKVLLDILERGNLFVSTLDDKRHWFRYHRLFADVLRVHLMEEQTDHIPTLHRRASAWYEHKGYEIEAFKHAAAGNDIDRAERLIEGKGMPLQFRGAGAPVLAWIESLPKSALNARPSLWVTYASTLLFGGQHTAVEGTLQAAEAALGEHEADDRTRDLLGRVASMRATLAVIQRDAEAIIAQSRRALEYLRPDNLPVRTATTWTLGYAYQLQGDRAAASRAYAEVIAAGESFGESIYTTAATITLGQLQEADLALESATRSYQRALELAGEPPQRMVSEAFLGLARIQYERNDLDAAEELGQQCLQLIRQMKSVDTSVSHALFLAHLRMAQGDVTAALSALEEAEAFIHRYNFMFRWPDVIAARVLALLRQGHFEAAAQLAEAHELPAMAQARVHLARGESSSAWNLLQPLRQKMEEKGWAGERLRVMVLQALASHAQGDDEQAWQLLVEALALAEPVGLIRVFVDEGRPMADLLREATSRGASPHYIRQLLAALDNFEGSAPVTQLLSDPLTERELEVLELLRTELNGPEIARELMVALNTMRTHTKNIYSKLGVSNRGAAVLRAEELGLL